MSDQEVMDIILHRLNHQDRSLDEIKTNQADMKMKLDTHMQMEGLVKPSIDELIAVLNGSKMIGRFVLFVASIVGGAWAVVVWAKDHIRL